MFKFFYALVKILLLLLLPFILLVRGSVYLHEYYTSSPAVSLLGGIVLSSLVLLVYLSFLNGKITGRIGTSRHLMRRSVLAFILVLGYGAYTLLYISGSNTKHEAVRKEYRELHPILRVAISTIVFADQDLIITDASRVKEDYRKMGLPAKNRSLHYRQSDGYVHAVDLRTIDRSTVRNFLLRAYFHGMGFNTIRHGGTGDHLHVSLRSHDTPGAL